MSVTLEQERIDNLFSRVKDLDDVARTMPPDDPRRATLDKVIRAELTEAEPVRPRIAAALLHLTEKTVRAWLSEGVLTAAVNQPRVLLEPSRLYEVVSLVRDLRSAGRTTGLLDEVFRRLSDSALLEREDLQRSLSETAEGKGTLVRGPEASANPSSALEV